VYTREVHLVEVFAGETVILSIDGSEFARSERTVTDPRKGYARIIRVSLPSTVKVVDLQIAETGAKVSIDIAPERLRYLRVFLRNGALTAEVIDEEQYRLNPMGYG